MSRHRRMPGLHAFLTVAAASSLCLQAAGPAARADVEGQKSAPPPLFDKLGNHTRKITTKSEQAQRYLDQGLTWTSAFNHDEAIRAFQEVARLDPDSAMAQWGISLCNGPHINNPIMDEPHSKAAWDALQKGLALKDKASPAEGARRVPVCCHDVMPPRLASVSASNGASAKCTAAHAGAITARAPKHHHAARVMAIR